MVLITPFAAVLTTAAQKAQREVGIEKKLLICAWEGARKLPNSLYNKTTTAITFHGIIRVLTRVFVDQSIKNMGVGKKNNASK